MKKHNLAAVSTVILGLASLTNGAHAASVVWSAPQAITSNLDIQNPGSVHTALNIGTASTGTINVDVGGTNVAFSNVTPLPNSGANSDFYNDGMVSSDFESVLDSFNWDQSSSSTISFSGLTAGGTYLLQAFASDGRINASFDWKLNLDVGGTTTILESAINSGAVGSNGQEFINGTVTLAAGETSFDLVTSNAPGAFADVGVLNAVVLSQTAVPEPSAFLLSGLGLIGLLRRRR